GILCRNETGVQTCALPISTRCACAISAMPTRSLNSTRMVSVGPPGTVMVRGVLASSLAVTFAPSAPWISTSVLRVAVSVISGVGKSPSSCNQPVCPGAGHQAVSGLPSAAAVNERAGLAPPKADASLADDFADNRTSPSSTVVNGPALG